MTIHRVVEFVYQSYCREQEVANKTALLLSFGLFIFTLLQSLFPFLIMIKLNGQSVPLWTRILLKKKEKGKLLSSSKTLQWQFGSFHKDTFSSLKKNV